MADQMIAIVLVRGIVGTSEQTRSTLRMLRLDRKNHCVIVAKTPSFLGMTQKVKDYITWGDVDAETIALLKKKMENGVIRLQPPRKGFGRKGIKVPFSVGGALGYRGEKINDLLKRMVP